MVNSFISDVELGAVIILLIWIGITMRNKATKWGEKIVKRKRN